MSNLLKLKRNVKSEPETGGSILGIYLTQKQIRYQVKKNKNGQEDSEKLNAFLQKISNEGGSVKVQKYIDGNVRCLSVSTSKMIKGFRGSHAEVVQIDTTFGLENSGHKLVAILYRNGSTGKGEVAQCSFIADETQESYEFALGSLDYLREHQPAVIIIDKVTTDIDKIKVPFSRIGQVRAHENH